MSELGTQQLNLLAVVSLFAQGLALLLFLSQLAAELVEAVGDAETPVHQGGVARQGLRPGRTSRLVLGGGDQAQIDLLIQVPSDPVALTGIGPQDK